MTPGVPPTDGATGPDGDPEHCPGCGRPVTECPGCTRALDPPRYCRRCGGWLAVTVTPGGWTARCRAHGELTAPG